jgi:hypothetical protein
MSFKNVTNIRDYCFYLCTAHKIVLPECLTSIGKNCFFSYRGFQASTNNNYYSDLEIYKLLLRKNIIVLATTPPTSGVLKEDVYSNINIFVPDESIDLYKSATN